MTQLRESQKEILAYQGGRMGIAAVPGAGKTWTLGLLAADLIERGAVGEDQEVLVVTLVHSAVDTFYRRVRALLPPERLAGVLPVPNLRVRTLHALAHDILREKPGMAGLAYDFQILDERAAEEILTDLSRIWAQENSESLEYLLNENLSEYRREWTRRERLPGIIFNAARSFIRQAKDWQLGPAELQARLKDSLEEWPLASMGISLYARYQRVLRDRNAIDFDDLIRFALEVLQKDSEYSARLRQRWPFILEDEAQDSSRLQEKILDHLAGTPGNWVRVGDPNQAIYETFTTANPWFLRRFLMQPGVRQVHLPVSGRSTPSLIRLSNAFVAWTQEQHPLLAVRDALQAPPWIEPAGPDDPQTNPPDQPEGIFLSLQRMTAQEEIEAIGASLERWLPDHPKNTVAVLAARNATAFEVVNMLRARKLPYDDSLLRSSSSTRFSAGVLGNLLRFLAAPTLQDRLAIAYRVWRREARENEALWQQVEHEANLLRDLERVEDYLWPAEGRDWLEQVVAVTEGAETEAFLSQFRRLARRWLEASGLPIDQLVSFLAQDLLTDPTELTLSYRLGALLRQSAQEHPNWRLSELADELGVIARNERRFLGVTPVETGFNPDAFPGVVVVSTLHKAKGLEWDRVYLMSVSQRDFPAGMDGERYISEPPFLLEGVNLEAESLEQLKCLLAPDEMYRLGAASHQARLDVIRERLRLLYVGITRARQELFMSWNNGRGGEMQPALALTALAAFWKEENPLHQGETPEPSDSSPEQE